MFLIFCSHKSKNLFKQCSSNTNNELIYLMHIQHYFYQGWMWRLIFDKSYCKRYYHWSLTTISPASAIPNISRKTHTHTYLWAVIIGTCTFIYTLAYHFSEAKRQETKHRLSLKPHTWDRLWYFIYVMQFY